MVRSIMYVFTFIVISCSYNTTIYGKIRLKESKFHINPNNNDIKIYELIDTFKVYQLSKIYSLNMNNQKIKELDILDYKANCFFKFYKQGRLAFYMINKDSIINKNSFDIKKAYMGYYTLSKQVFGKNNID